MREHKRLCGRREGLRLEMGQRSAYQEEVVEQCQDIIERQKEE